MNTHHQNGSPENIIHGLWIGEALSPIELLTLHSYIRNGYEFWLWIYMPIKTQIPKEVKICDANEIIPFEQVFRKKEADPNYNVGKGSFGAPFSDIFRYKLLYEKGGIWTDMDITCLKPYNFTQPYFFRVHPILPVIGNLMKCPPKSQVMLDSYLEANEKCNQDTKEWLTTNKILNKHIEIHGFKKYIVPEISNMDNWHHLEKFLFNNGKIPEQWYFIHWMNEEWKNQKLKKEVVFFNTTLQKLMKKYDVKHEVNYSFFKKKKRLIQSKRKFQLVRDYYRMYKKRIFE